MIRRRQWLLSQAEMDRRIDRIAGQVKVLCRVVVKADEASLYRRAGRDDLALRALDEYDALRAEHST